jgi:hypothetical protein
MVWSRPTPTLLPGNMRVPLCLTRIVPALTVCPANRFTPSRCDWLSRPLRLEPPPFIFEDDDPVTLSLALRGGNYLGALDRWRAQRYLVTIGDAQHLVQFDAAAFGHGQSFNLYRLARRHLILFAAGFNYGVNNPPPRTKTKSLYQLPSAGVKYGSVARARGL